MVNVIVAGARTPIGKLGGALAQYQAHDLGGLAVAETLRRSQIDPEEVDTVLLGQVVQANAGPNPARIAASKAGIPMSVPAATLNNLCLSGPASISLADSLIAAVGIASSWLEVWSR